MMEMECGMMMLYHSNETKSTRGNEFENKAD